MITFALFTIFGFAFLVLALRGRRRVPWASKLARVNVDSVANAEWMAPDEVVRQVERDYMAAIHWLQDAAMVPAYVQMHDALEYFEGEFLERYRHHVDYDRSKSGCFVGILRADHSLKVCRFTEDGEHCIVLDSQSERRIATYDRETHHRLHTQHMDDVTVVYQMVYDLKDEHWKIEAFVQELPLGWCKVGAVRHIRLQADLPTTVGRDS